MIDTPVNTWEWLDRRLKHLRETEQSVSEDIAKCEQKMKELRDHNIRCNHCGSQMDEWDIEEDYHIHTTVGYGSAYDGDEIDLRLCCKCFDKLVGECAVPPYPQPV
jgi:hypothetical protein